MHDDKQISDRQQYQREADETIDQSENVIIMLKVADLNSDFSRKPRNY